MNERRVFEREIINIPFIYSYDEGETLLEGEWKEGVTIDIGPVLIGGLAFYTEETVEVNRPIRIALFMDLELKRIWEKEREGFPVIYHGIVRRIFRDEKGQKVAVLFHGLSQEEE